MFDIMMNVVFKLKLIFFAEPPQSRYARRQSVCAEAYNPDESDDDDEQMVRSP